MLKGGLVLIWELDMNLVPTLVTIQKESHFEEEKIDCILHSGELECISVMKFLTIFGPF